MFLISGEFRFHTEVRLVVLYTDTSFVLQIRVGLFFVLQIYIHLIIS